MTGSKPEMDGFAQQFRRYATPNVHVVPDTAFKNAGVLRDEGGDFPEVAQFPAIGAIDRKTSVIGVIQTGEYAHEHALAGAARTHQLDLFPALQRKRDGIERSRFAAGACIAEV
jgi:hypothetical protein